MGISSPISSESTHLVSLIVTQIATERRDGDAAINGGGLTTHLVDYRNKTCGLKFSHFRPLVVFGFQQDMQYLSYKN